MKKREQIETQRGLERLQEEIEAFDLATEPGAKTRAFRRAMRRYRAVLVRSAGGPGGWGPVKDIYLSAQARRLICDIALWLEMWKADRELGRGTTPNRAGEISAQFSTYLDEMRRVYRRLPEYIETMRALDAQRPVEGRPPWVDPEGPKRRRTDPAL